MNTATVLGRFPAISLPELQTSAALQTRYDRKYTLDARALPALLSSLDPRARALEIAGRRSFQYDSIYFDTPAYDGYLLAAHGRRHRFKIRTRHYLDSGLRFLEIKTHGKRGQTVKRRTPVGASQLASIDELGYSFLDKTLLSMTAAPAASLELRPVLRTRYRRATLLLADGVTRTTIDTSPEWEGPDGRRIIPEQMVIVETKTAGGASELDRLLWRTGCRPDRISKYATGLALLHPQLPANRWHRVLRKDFPRLRPAA